MSTNRYIDKLKARLAKEADQRMQLQALLDDQVARNRALLAERDALKDLLRGVYPHLCARRDEQDLDDAQQYVLAEECQELIDGIDAALQGEQP